MMAGVLRRPSCKPRRVVVNIDNYTFLVVGVGVVVHRGMNVGAGEEGAGWLYYCWHRGGTGHHHTQGTTS